MITGSEFYKWLQVFNIQPGGGGGGGVTNVGSGTGLTGGPITTTGTISLATIANNTLLANVSGSAVAPSSTTLTSMIDNAIGNTQGDVLYRDASVWSVLAPGTAGQALLSGGASANPSWGAPSLATIANNDLLANISGSTNVPTATTLTALIDSAIGNVQGDILYRNASAWVALPPGTAGQILETGGAGANPSWANSGVPTFPLDPNLGGTGINNGSNTLTVNANSVINQDVSTTASPDFVNASNSLVNVTASGTPITLVATSAQSYQVTGSTSQQFNLPDATTLQEGASYNFINQVTGRFDHITIHNNAGTLLFTTGNGTNCGITVTLINNSTSNGTWTTSTIVPGVSSITEWNDSALVMSNSNISCGTLTANTGVNILNNALNVNGFGVSVTGTITTNGALNFGGIFSEDDDVVFSGAFPTTINITGATNVTMPTSGTLLTTSAGIFTSTNVFEFDSQGTYSYTPSVNMSWVYVECWGPGGGSGGVAAGLGAAGGSGGGGGGGYCGLWYSSVDIAGLGGTVSFTVGAGGAGGAAGNNAGSAGTSTSFDVLTAAPGNPTNGVNSTSGFELNSGGIGGLGSGGQTNIPGNNGLCSFGWGATQGVGGDGGAAPGLCNTQAIPGAPGANGIYNGSGGSGASCINTTTDAAGGTGADGKVRFTEYLS